MSEHVAEYLPELALGVLDPGTETRVLEHLRECASCAAWLTELRAAVPSSASLAATDGIPTPPAEAGPQRLAALSLMSVPARPRVEVHRFQDVRSGDFSRLFKVRVAELFAIGHAQAALTLGQAEQDASWLDGPVAGIRLLPVPSPLDGALTVIVRAVPGAVFPRHRHIGDEWTLVLQGGFESNGQSYFRGDRLCQRSGSVHTLVALPGPTCLCCVRLMGEMEFG